MRRVSQRKVREAEEQLARFKAANEVMRCPLCLRPITPHSRTSKHHLVPRLKGGTHGETVLLHHICHNAIHARFTEAELARTHSTIDDLRASPIMQDYLEWVADKPPEFHARTAPRGGRRKG